MESTPTVDALLQEVKNQARTGDDNVRRTILDKLSETAYSIELPEDTMQRVLYLVSRLISSSPDATTPLRPKYQTWTNIIATKSCFKICLRAQSYSTT